ncbi:hypothetical protein BGI31_09170 [Snodgrassella communis]|jgi:hypothetical protein|nr:hypothetical protein BGI31_09170 [Snodgrassella communis]
MVFPLMGVIAGNSDSLFISRFSGSQYIQRASLIAKILSTRHLAEIPLSNIARLDLFIVFNVCKRCGF